MTNLPWCVASWECPVFEKKVRFLLVVLAILLLVGTRQLCIQHFVPATGKVRTTASQFPAGYQVVQEREHVPAAWYHGGILDTSSFQQQNLRNDGVGTVGAISDSGICGRKIFLDLGAHDGSSIPSFVPVKVRELYN